MTFTPLHKAVGAAPGPLTEQLLDEAIEQGVEEAIDLDWKEKLYPMKGLNTTDVPKDVAAFANSGGGIIVYGVSENGKKATTRSAAAGEDWKGLELYERAFKAATINAITPPVFGVRLEQISESPLAVAAIIPASTDVPHLIYTEKGFGAPIRNGADTVWMKEREIAAMYRSRFEEQRQSAEALQRLFEEALDAVEPEWAWVVAAANPRIPGLGRRLDQQQANGVLNGAVNTAASFGRHVRQQGPISRAGYLDAAVGFRSWILPNRFKGMPMAADRGSWYSIHDSGAVGAAAAVGGSIRRYVREEEADTRGDIHPVRFEAFLAEFGAVVWELSQILGTVEYEVQIGISYEGQAQLLELDVYGQDWEPIAAGPFKPRPIRLTLDPTTSQQDFQSQVYDMAQDCLNLGGIREPRYLQKPAEAAGDREEG